MTAVRRRGEKRKLLGDLSEAVTASQDAVDALDDVAALRLGVNRTDLRCLSILGRHGPMSASELADQVDLSRPATTAALDRLAAAGYLRRVHDNVDRRRVLVEITPRARRATDEIWGPVAEEGLAKASAYTVDELRLILDFLRADRALQEKHVARLRTGVPTRAASRGRDPVVSPRR